MYSMDQKKYKSSADASLVEVLPMPMPLYEDIRQGNVGFLLQAFTARKEVLLKQIRQGSTQQNVIRWQACVEALDAACHFLTQQKI